MKHSSRFVSQASSFVFKLIERIQPWQRAIEKRGKKRRERRERNLSQSIHQHLLVLIFTIHRTYSIRLDLFSSDDASFLRASDGSPWSIEQKTNAHTTNGRLRSSLSITSDLPLNRFSYRCRWPMRPQLFRLLHRSVLNILQNIRWRLLAVVGFRIRNPCYLPRVSNWRRKGWSWTDRIHLSIDD